MSFTARRISTGQREGAIDSRLVLRCEQVKALDHAAAIVDRARRTAFLIVKEARKAAKRRDVRSMAARRARKAEADVEFATRAAALEEAYCLAQAALTAQLETTLDRVLDAALAHVGATVPAAERLRIVCEQLSKAAGPIPAARLRLCPADAALFRGTDRHSPWPTELDETLKPGCCRLVSDQGEWALDFDALMASLGPRLSPQR